MLETAEAQGTGGIMRRVHTPNPTVCRSNERYLDEDVGGV
jgi:hypothetical protein